MSFTKDELTSYVKARALGLSDKTIYRIDKAAGMFWDSTNGTVSKKHILDELKGWWQQAAIEGAKLVRYDNRIAPILDDENDPKHADVSYLLWRVRNDRR